MKIDTKNLKIADVRYYDSEHNGLELTCPISKVVLYNRGDTYVNLLNPIDFTLVCKRVPGPTSWEGERLETRIVPLAGQVVTGEAWLVTDFDFGNYFGSDTVDLEDVENFVLHSSYFYKDRLAIVQRKLSQGRISWGLRRDLMEVLASDMEEHEAMKEFFEERKPQKVIQK